MPDVKFYACMMEDQIIIHFHDDVMTWEPWGHCNALLYRVHQGSRYLSYSLYRALGLHHVAFQVTLGNFGRCLRKWGTHTCMYSSFSQFVMYMYTLNSPIWGSIGPTGKISQGPHWIFRNLRTRLKTHKSPGIQKHIVAITFIFMAHQQSFWVWPQPMRGDVTL